MYNGKDFDVYLTEGERCKHWTVQ